MRRILDADGHVIERDPELLEYLDPPYRGNTALLGYPFFPTLDGFQRGAILARNGMYKDYNITAATWLDFMDQTVLESTVLYPTAGLALGLIQDPEWAVAVAKVYNNWFTERYHRVNPDRLRGVALLPLQEPEEAVQELRRGVTELGMVGGPHGVQRGRPGALYAAGGKAVLAHLRRSGASELPAGLPRLSFGRAGAGSVSPVCALAEFGAPVCPDDSADQRRPVRGAGGI